MIAMGLLSLLHSAYSAAQHRSYVRLVEQQFNGLPADIVIQSVVSLVVSIVAIVWLNGSQLKEIRALDDLNEKSIDSINNRPNFYIFNHRGRLLR